MSILSIDVGIKNLSFCFFKINKDNNQYQIYKWDVINLVQDNIYCTFNLCNKPAKYCKNLDFFCCKHSKKQTFYKIPEKENTKSFISKQKLSELYLIADKYKIIYQKNIKKQELILLLIKYFDKFYLNKIEKVNSNDFNLIQIGSLIKDKFNILFINEEKITHIIIENQISPIANRMKTIQGMLVQYFIMSGIQFENIEFISATNKLKVSINDKIDLQKQVTTYKERKNLGISNCSYFLSNYSNYKSFLSFFNGHIKKDDLADCFLQGLWYIQNKIKLN